MPATKRTYNFGPFKIDRAQRSKSNTRGRWEIWHAQHVFLVCGQTSISQQENSTAKQALCGMLPTSAWQKVQCALAAGGWRLKRTRLRCTYYSL